MPSIFGHHESTGLWLDDEYSRTDYVGEALTDTLIAEVETALGYKIPGSYVELMREQNGGLLRRTTFKAEVFQVKVQGIYGINFSKRASLGGVTSHREAFIGRNPKTGKPIEVEARSFRTGSRFWIEEWGYPAIGIYFADCPSAGHDVICLDYRACGPQGEPQVVHVCQSSAFQITPLSRDFESFIRGLV